MKIKAFIFDFDGTLVDSEMFHCESWKEFLNEEYNITFEEQDYFLNYAGIPTTEIAKEVKRNHHIAMDITDIVKRIDDIAAKKATEANIGFMPFAKEVLDQIHQWNIPMSIVTGSSRHEAAPVLEKLEIVDYFDHIITRDDVQHSKPDPEGYKRCAKLMGYQPEEYLVFEDTWAGVSAAKRASLPCYGIQRTKEYQTKLTAAGADKVFLNLKEALEDVVKEQETFKISS